MTFDLELLKAILGVFSIVGATASGIAALLVDYRDKTTGKVTKWGRYALFGLALSFLIGGSNLWVDYTQKTREARETADRSREATEKTLQIVTDISRTLNPLKDVRADFWLTYQFDRPDLTKYRQRLDEGVHALFPRLGKVGSVEGVFASVFLGDVIEEVTIDSDSPLFPSFPKELFAYSILGGTTLNMDFYKTPIDPASLSQISVPGPKPDIHMAFHAPPSRHQIELVYDLKSKKITLHGISILSDQKYWNSSGAIVSVLDLPGTQLIIRPEHVLAASGESEKRMVPNLTVLLNIAERRGWWLREGRLKLFAPQDGWPIYAYTFPKTYRELLFDAEAK